MKDPYPHPALEYLLRAMAGLESPEAAFDLLQDLCTVKEIQDMAQRMQTAILLDEGHNYQTISEKVGVSTATISRVSRCLQYGSGGYRAVLNRIREENKHDDP